jgi:DNA-binding CsgD family transcriptional regulator
MAVVNDQTKLEALVRFSDEEIKHQALFRRIDEMIGDTLPPGYHFDADADEVAVTVLDKPYHETDLLDAIDQAWRLSYEYRERRVHRRVIRRRIAALSPSERQVLDLVVDGISNKSIAGKLELSVRTVENRRRGIFQKMNADSVAELVRMILLANDDERRQMA